MINKIYKYIFFFLSLVFINLAHAEDGFFFEGKIIEYKDGNNLIYAKDNVLVTTMEGFKASANESRYYRNLNKLILVGDVKIIDNNKNITLQSDEVEYQKNLELITSKNKTTINVNNNFFIITKNINYLRNKETISSNYETSVTDNFGNQVKSSDFILSIAKKEFKTKQINLLDKDSNEYIADNVMIDLSKNQLAGKDIKMYFKKTDDLNSHARLKGNSITSNDRFTTIKKGIFTNCKPNDNCPTWSLESEEIVHDKLKKTINYKNATLRILDKPVFYFPKFFHPDPSVDRQSGFLMPSIISSSSSGSSIMIPYYYMIANNKDMTIQPRFYFNDDILLQSEFRQVEKNIDHISDISVKKSEQNSKTHFFSNTKITTESEKFDSSSLEINLEKTSNDTYLKSEKLTNSIQDNDSLLNSYIKYEAFSDDLELLVETQAYEDLTKKKNSDKYQFILPSFTVSKFIYTDLRLLENLTLSSKGSIQKRDTNITENSLINDVQFSSDKFFLTKNLLSNFEINYKNSFKKGTNSATYQNNFKNENFLKFFYNTSYPLKKIGNTTNSSLIPKLSLSYSPFKSENISNLDRNIEVDNIFSNNRLGLSDSLEGGQSLTFGLDYELFKADNSRNILETSIAQVYRDTNDSNLPITSKMRNKSSDVVGEVNFSPLENFGINYTFSADNNLDTINYNFLNTEISVNNFVTSFEFLEENNEIGSDSYFSKMIKYKFNNSNNISFNSRRNRKTNLTEFYNLIYEYENDCLVAAIEYNKDYYEDRDIKPNEEIFFSLTITPFASISSPSIK